MSYSCSMESTFEHFKRKWNIWKSEVSPWNFLLWGIYIYIYIGFTLLYFKMAMMPFVPETKMADIGKLISLGNLLVRKVTWLVLTTTSATLILSRVFGADCMTRIFNYILTSSKNSFFSISTHRNNILSYTVTYRDNTHSLSLTFWFPAVNPTKMYMFCNLFLSSFAFSGRLAPASNTTAEISSNPKRDKQPTWEKTHSTSCYISTYRYLIWNT